MANRRELLIEGSTSAAAMRAMGPFFIEELMEDASRLDSSASIKRDWFTVAAWLGHKEGPLTSEQKRRVAEAWTAYMTIGVAPSKSIQPTFDSISNELEETPATKPPTAIMDVFDRLMASDEEIKAKRVTDIQDERQRLQEVFSNVGAVATPRVRSSRAVRQGIFFSIMWFAAVYLYAWLFDPLDEGGWDRLDTDDFNRLLVIALLPPIAATALAIYRRFVR